MVVISNKKYLSQNTTTVSLQWLFTKQTQMVYTHDLFTPSCPLGGDAEFILYYGGSTKAIFFQGSNSGPHYTTKKVKSLLVLFQLVLAFSYCKNFSLLLFH